MSAAAVYLAADGRELTQEEIKALTGEEKLKARDRANRTAGIAEGKKRALAELAKIGLQTQEEYSQLAQLRAERDARPTAGEEAKHGRHQRWLGFAIGVPAGMILACAAIFAMQGIIWDTATRSFREQAMTGAIISSQGEQQSEGYTNPGQDVTRRP
jgi:hypothetical protein